MSLNNKENNLREDKDTRTRSQFRWSNIFLVDAPNQHIVILGDTSCKLFLSGDLITFKPRNALESLVTSITKNNKPFMSSTSICYSIIKTANADW